MEGVVMRKRRLTFFLGVAVGLSGFFLPTNGLTGANLPRQIRILRSLRQSYTTEETTAATTAANFTIKLTRVPPVGVFPQKQSDKADKADKPSAALQAKAVPLHNSQQSKVNKKAEYQWLTWMHHQFNSQKVGAKVDESVIKRVLAAMDRYAKMRTLRAAVHAEALLGCYIQESTRPVVMNVAIFNAAMNAYAQIGDPVGVQRILKRMTELRAEYPELRPDIISFTCLANAWVKSRRYDAATRAEAVLRYVEQQQHQQSDYYLAPSTQLYNVVLSAWSESRDANKILRAEALVKRMQAAGTVVSATECSGTAAAPDMYTYQTLMTVYSKTRSRGAPEKAEAMLLWLEEHEELEPEAHCYAAVIVTWAYSNELGKAERAYQVLLKMRRRYEELGLQHCRPNVVVFTSVLTACNTPAADWERQTAFGICSRVMQELLQSPQYGTPNFLTYAAYLQAIATTLDEGDARRDEETKRIFAQCCQAGQVGEIVLAKLRKAASPELLADLLATVKDTERLPSYWTRNVRGERRRQ